MEQKEPDLKRVKGYTEKLLATASPSCPSAGSPPNFLEEEELVDKVMRLLSSEIFTHLTAQQLLVCRFVNSNWRNLAIQFMTSRRDRKFQLTFQLEVPIKTHVLLRQLAEGGTKKDENMTLKKFVDDMNASSHNKISSSSQQQYLTPFNNFCFEAAGSLETEDIQEFLDTHGPTIKILELSLGDAPKTRTNLTTLSKLLVTQAPNIEQLTLYRLPKAWSQNTNKLKLFPETSSVHLENLKSLHLSRWVDSLTVSRLVGPTFRPIIAEILKAAVNLRSFTGWHVSFIDEILSTKKIHTVNSFKFWPSNVAENPSEIDWYEKLANSGPRLKRLLLLPHQCGPSDLDLQRRMVQSLTKILDSSQHSMTYLNMSIVDGRCMMPFGPRVKWPVMSNVTTLVLQVSENRREVQPDENMKGAFPLGFIPQILPNVRRIYLSFFMPGFEGIGLLEPGSILFSKSGKISSVRHANINHQNVPPALTQRLPALFPTLETP